MQTIWICFLSYIRRNIHLALKNLLFTFVIFHVVFHFVFCCRSYRLRFVVAYFAYIHRVSDCLLLCFIWGFWCIFSSSVYFSKLYWAENSILFINTYGSREWVHTILFIFFCYFHLNRDLFDLNTMWSAFDYFSVHLYFYGHFQS